MDSKSLPNNYADSDFDSGFNAGTDLGSNACPVSLCDRGIWADLTGAVLFYTCLPLPALPTRFERVALLAPVVGLFLGGLVGLGDRILAGVGMPLAVVSLLAVLGQLWLTGGLHLDGVIDTADGLAVMETQRRLAVMADSRTGAFGVMGAIALLLLKVTALTCLPYHRWWALVAAAAWGRWAQQWAIGCYPYLRSEGKGAFHQSAIRSGWDCLPGLGLLVGLTLGAATLGWLPWTLGLTAMAAGMGSGIALSAYFAKQLGGHTGDTYGAVVEWTEAAVLVALTML